MKSIKWVYGDTFSCHRYAIIKCMLLPGVLPRELTVILEIAKRMELQTLIQHYVVLIV